TTINIKRPNVAMAPQAVKELRVLGQGLKGMRGVAVSGDGKRALAAAPKEVFVWDVDTGKELARYSAPTGFIMRAAFVRDGKQAVWVGSDRIIRVWDTATGAEVRSFTAAGTGVPLCIAASPDGREALVPATESSGHTVRLWDLTNGKEVRSLPGHT